MTVIKKKKKSVTGAKKEKQTVKTKQEEGVSLSQSGSWFQKHKLVVTWVLVTAFAFTCIGFVGLYAVVSKQEDERKTQAVNGTQTEEMSQIARLKEEVAANPGNAMAVANLGYAYHEAATNMSQRQALDPQAGIDSKELDEYYTNAVVNYEKALDLDPSYFFPATNLAALYISRGEADKAIELITPILEREKVMADGKLADGVEEPSLGILVSNLIAAYEMKKDYDKVLALAPQAEKIAPDSSELYLALAKSYLAKNDNEKALEAVSKANELVTTQFEFSGGAISLDFVRGLIDIQELQGDLYARNNNPEKARESYESALNYAGLMRSQDVVSRLTAKVAGASPEGAEGGKKINILDQKVEDGRLKMKLDDGREIDVPIPGRDSGAGTDAAAPAAAEGDAAGAATRQ